MEDSNIMVKESRIADLNKRTSGLNEIGAHYFVGWLISAGFQRPEVMAELEWVLEDMETDPNLRHCWMKEEAKAGPLNAATECVAAPEPETVPVTRESAPLPAEVLAAPPNPLGKIARCEAKPARRSLFPPRLLEALFGKPRIAA